MGVEALASSILERITNFFLPVEPVDASAPLPATREQKPNLRLHSAPAMRVYVAAPQNFDDVRLCADQLRNNITVIINFERVDAAMQQRVNDFLQGVTYILGGHCQRVSETVLVYAPSNIDVSKETYAYAVPAYVKRTSLSMEEQNMLGLKDMRVPKQ